MSGYARGELEAWLVAVSGLLRAAAPVHALIGGVAVMHHARRAFTRDIDFLVAFGPGEKDRLVADATAAGLLVERKSDWQLRLHGGEHYADIVDAQVPLEVGTATEAELVRTDLGEVRIARIEHLVALKHLAGRPRDRADLLTIFDEHPGLDVEAVNALLEPFGEKLQPPPSPADP